MRICDIWATSQNLWHLGHNLIPSFSHPAPSYGNYSENSLLCKSAKKTGFLIPRDPRLKLTLQKAQTQLFLISPVPCLRNFTPDRYSQEGQSSLLRQGSLRVKGLQCPRSIAFTEEKFLPGESSPEDQGLPFPPMTAHRVGISL